MTSRPSGQDGLMSDDVTVEVRLDATSADPPYEQVRRQLAWQIAEGTLASGFRLPTVRALASHLGVAANTVARSYRELEAAGLVETAGRAGTLVSAGGREGRLQLVIAAQTYAALSASLGVEADEARNIVLAALAQSG